MDERFVLKVDIYNADPNCEIKTEVVDELVDRLYIAGYRKPRIITTLEELNSLPVGSVIRDPDGSVGELADGSRLGFPRFIHWTGVDFPDKPVAGLNLPATALYVPEEQK